MSNVKASDTLEFKFIFFSLKEVLIIEFLYKTILQKKVFFSEIASPPQGSVMHPIVATSAEFPHNLGKQKK